jgi:alpha-mannosidase
LNHPLLPVATDIHAGALPSAADAVSVTPAAVLLSAVKKCEDEDALIFRLFETAGKPASATVKLDPALFGTVAEAMELDLLERPVASSTADFVPKGFRVKLTPHGIASVRVRFQS